MVPYGYTRSDLSSGVISQVTSTLSPLGQTVRLAMTWVELTVVTGLIVPGLHMLQHPVANPFPLRLDGRQSLHKIPHRQGELDVALKDQVVGDVAPAAYHCSPRLE
jgi:hypothetical protein